MQWNKISAQQPEPRAAIDELVDEQMKRGPRAALYPTCEHCGHTWHGLPCDICVPGMGACRCERAYEATEVRISGIQKAKANIESVMAMLTELGVVW
jgi:hypothetical protein